MVVRMVCKWADRGLYALCIRPESESLAKGPGRVRWSFAGGGEGMNPPFLSGIPSMVGTGLCILRSELQIAQIAQMGEGDLRPRLMRMAI